MKEILKDIQSQISQQTYDKIHKEKQAKKAPSFPPNYLPKRKSKSETGSLTSAVIDYVSLRGGFAERRNTQGNWNEKLGRWIKSGTTNGSADISIVYKGLAIAVELKVGKDKLSPDQIKYKELFEKAGGIYYECRNIDSFIAFFDKIKEKYV